MKLVLRFAECFVARGNDTCVKTIVIALSRVPEDTLDKYRFHGHNLVNTVYYGILLIDSCLIFHDYADFPSTIIARRTVAWQTEIVKARIDSHWGKMS